MLIHSCGYELVALGDVDRGKLAAHWRRLCAHQSADWFDQALVPRTLRDYAARIDFTRDLVVAACEPSGEIIASAQVHSPSPLLPWAELAYTAAPNARALGACGQAIVEVVKRARSRGFDFLTACAPHCAGPDVRLLARAGFVLSVQDGGLLAELDLGAGRLSN